MKYIITLASIVVAGMFIVSGPMCNAGGKAGSDKGANQEKPVAKVGDFAILGSQIEQAASQGNDSGSPMQAVQALGQALANSVEAGVVLQVAAKDGVVMSDAEIKQEALNTFDQQMAIGKIQLMMNGQLKSNATDEDFQAAYLKSTGKTVAQAKDEYGKIIDDALKDPSKRQQLFASFVQSALEQHVATTLNPTDQEVKSQFETLTFKRIFIPSPAAGKDDSAEQAAAALKAIKGGLSFEAAMDRYSKDPAPTGKRVSDSTSTMAASQLAGDPNLAALLKMKAGAISDVISVPGGVAIYKIDSVKSAVPSDFEQKKDNYRKTFVQAIARGKVQAEVADALKDPKITWTNTGYQAVYDYQKAVSSHVSAAEQKKLMESVVTEAKAAQEAGYDDRPAALAKYAASTFLYTAADPAEKAKMKQDRVDVLNELLKYTESTDVRLELSDLYVDLKDPAQAVSNLLMAAQTNSDIDAVGQSNYNAINARIEKLKKAGVLKPDDEKKIEAEQKRWLADRTDRDKAVASAKARDEADRKLAAEDIKKRDAEAKKNQPAAAGGTKTQPTKK